MHLTRNEFGKSIDLTVKALSGNLSPEVELLEIRPALRPFLRFHIAAAIAAAGDVKSAQAWLAAGALEEKENMACAYMAGFLQRHGAFSMPTTVFEDPRPYIHFTTVPSIDGMRRRFHRFAARTLPSFDRPVRFMDVGCGNGTMGVELLLSLKELGVILAIEEIVLVDPFPAMLEIARLSAETVFPGVKVTQILGKSQDVALRLPDGLDITLCSLSIHHMPWEVKSSLVKELAKRSSEILLFEMDANHDTSALGSPEISLSVYQAYGGIIDAIFAHDAPLDVALGCVDLFLLAEVVSLLTQPRGERTEYHMTRAQWRRLFEEEAGCCMAAVETCLANSGVEFFGQHYRTS